MHATPVNSNDPWNPHCVETPCVEMIIAWRLGSKLRVPLDGAALLVRLELAQFLLQRVDPSFQLASFLLPF